MRLQFLQDPHGASSHLSYFAASLVVLQAKFIFHLFHVFLPTNTGSSCNV